MVKTKVGGIDYRLEVNGKDKTFHANLLKRYVDRLESAKCRKSEDKNDKGNTGVEV